MATFCENKTTFNSIFISYVKLIDDMVVCQNIVKLFFSYFNLKKNTNYIY